MRDASRTIAAIATPLGEGAIGVIRLSGPEAISIVESLFRGKRLLRFAKSHSLNYGKLVRRSRQPQDDSADEETLDEVLVAVMRGPTSYTGEDVVEIYCHGGVVVMETALREALAAGAVMAEPGEFTKRAFLNGRMDLAQAEAVIDLVRAKSPKGAALAAKQLEGRLSQRVGKVKSEMLRLLAHVQAAIDYPEEDIEALDGIQLEVGLETALAEVEALLAGAETGRVMREGVRAAIVGRPNVGKSSLLNALLKEERAIVTDIPGTTRDRIEEGALLGGVPFTLVDTAGLRPTDDRVEAVGVERAKDAAETADVILAVFDGSASLTQEDIAVVDWLAEARFERRLAVINKADLPQRIDEGALAALGAAPIVRVSALMEQGLEALVEAMIAQATGGEPISTDAALVTRLRHRRSLERCRDSLRRAIDGVHAGLTPDLISVDVQEGIESLAEVTGENVTEALVDEIFSNFCVGK